MKEDWIECELGDLLKLKNGFAFKASDYKKEGIPVFRIGDINDWIVSKKNAVRIDEKELYDDFIVETGDILIAMSGATTGKFGIYSSTEKAYQNQRVGNLKLYSEKFLNKNYVFYLLYSLKRDIEREAYGGAQPNISGEKIESLKTKLAPLPIQRAIVSKIEALFSDLDNGIASLKKAQEQLKVYRQAVLKKAFEGELTKEWREDYVKTHGRASQLPTAEELLKQIKEERQKNYELQITNEKSGQSNNQINPNSDKKEDNLPKGWKWVKLKDLGSWRGGGTPSKQVLSYWKKGTNLWVTSKDMKVDIILDSIDKITDEAIVNSSANYIPKGAILFVMRSGILRHTFPVAIAGKELTVNQDLQTLSPNGLATSEFIFWFIRAFNYDIRHKCSKDGTTVESIDSNALKNYPVILPPTLAEQTQIVQEIESRLSVTDNLEIVISNSIEKAEALRQSILKKAFEGKLLSEAEIEQCKQEPDYEPASELLKKIKMEKMAKQKDKSKTR